MKNEIKNKWSEIIEYLRDEYNINGVLFRTWIEPLEVISYENGTLVVAIDESKQSIFFYALKIEQLNTDLYSLISPW